LLNLASQSTAPPLVVITVKAAAAEQEGPDGVSPRRLLQLIVVLALQGVVVEVLAGPSDPLTCRLQQGPWLPCTMQLDANGLGWRLRIGAQQSLQFRHDGLGRVRMRRGSEPWQPVQARWLADASLCWDGVCARGPIPLD
jgi:hypothetical protein